MITYSEIMKAVNTKLQNEFQDIKIMSTNNEGIKRPSFFVQLTSIKTENFMTTCRDRFLTVVIYYFPKKRHKNQIELLEMQDNLETIFLQSETLNVEGYEAWINEIEIDMIDNKGQDKVMYLTFDIEFHEDWSRKSDHESMQDINLSKGVVKWEI